MEQTQKRLWIVRVMREAYVLAPDQDSAIKAQKDIERWEDKVKVTAESAEGKRLDGWNDLCLVYGTDKDMTLASARALVARA